ncbi:hypothetical protein SAMN05421788_11851 [Filimonas lacunae]|uniref:Uncharacterized protein n=1 Tax=Filimonas lacunae TaxID=477680 RepID=A0A1N7RHY6_9BACT|nr:hypothetical protein SAMN05421788_11851 [Filimonas lacunae]
MLLICTIKKTELLLKMPISEKLPRKIWFLWLQEMSDAPLIVIAPLYKLMWKYHPPALGEGAILILFTEK